jgi:D-tagatose-1,6-bisphosphate aldolase subunit GatZ/KbaZ
MQPARRREEKMNSAAFFRNLVDEQHRGNPAGIYSVCSSHPYAVRAALEQARRDDSVLLIESTSNQVNQFGGYTGMTPALFRRYVLDLAEASDFDGEKVLLGGDHLGPVPFQHEDEAIAMDKACGMVRSFVEAGFVKIHLDTSIPLGGGSGIETAEVAARCARLCRVCEDTYHRSGPPGGTGKRDSGPVYIIGTEVPVPGGSDEVEEGVQVTSAEDFDETVEVTRAAFQEEGLEDAWRRVIGVVVQPGVEFGDHRVIEYNRHDAAQLTQRLKEYPDLVFEAHSTDYQTVAAMRSMVEDGFAVLKVGPGLTFAFREAVFMLCAIESELGSTVGGLQPSNLIDVVDRAMVNNPAYWERYYGGSEQEKAYRRKYSLFDRVRYYWNVDEVQAALERLFHNLGSVGIPMALLSQYFPVQYSRVRDGTLEPSPQSLVMDRVREVVADFSLSAGTLRTGVAASSSVERK